MIKKYACFVYLQDKGWHNLGGIINVNIEKFDIAKVFKDQTIQIKRDGHLAYPVTHVMFYPIQDIMP